MCSRIRNIRPDVSVIVHCPTHPTIGLVVCDVLQCQVAREAWMVLGRPRRKPPIPLDIHVDGLERHVGAAQRFALVVVAGDPWRPIVSG